MTDNELVEWLIEHGVKVNGSYLDAEPADCHGHDRGNDLHNAERVRKMRINIGASYPETPEGMTEGAFAQELFEKTFSAGHTPLIDARTPKQVEADFANLADGWK